MMQLSIVTHDVVTIDDKQVIEVASKKLQSMLGGDGVEERDGVMMVYVFHDTHGSGYTDYLREATKDDLAIVRVLSKLREL